MIRILHIHTLPIISGSGINTFLSMKGMDGRFFRAELACAPGGRLINLVRRNNMKVWEFGHLVQPLSPFHDILATINIAGFLKKNNFHIVHTHNSKAGFIGRMAAGIARVPVIIHTVHGFAFHDQEPLLRRALFKYLEKIASHWCDKMIFISQPLMDWALRERITGPDKMVKIYSGIDPYVFHPVNGEEKARNREEWGIGNNDRVIGIVSKLWDGKGHVVLIEAFNELRKEIKDARLVIVGEGYLEDSLKDLVKKFGLTDSILFTGFQADVSGIISTFDVAVLPSFFEGMGRVLLEAMAMGKPVVGSRVGGIPDLIEDGVNGILVPPGSVAALKDALKSLLINKDLADSMAHEGQNKVSDSFSVDVMVSSIVEVYSEVLNRKGIKID